MRSCESPKIGSVINTKSLPTFSSNPTEMLQYRNQRSVRLMENTNLRQTNIRCIILYFNRIKGIRISALYPLIF